MKEIRKKAPKVQAVEEPASAKAVSDRLRGLVGTSGSGEGAAKWMPLIVYAVAAGLLLIVLAAVGWWLYQRQDFQALRLEEKGLQSLARRRRFHRGREGSGRRVRADRRRLQLDRKLGAGRLLPGGSQGANRRSGQSGRALPGNHPEVGGKEISPPVPARVGLRPRFQGRMDEAIAAFESAGKDPRGIPDMALFEAARIRQGRGEREKALEGYKKIEAEYPQSAMIQAARQRIVALGGSIAETKEKKPSAPAEKN